MIPKIIWSFSNNSDNSCVHLLRENNPHYTIFFLNKTNFDQFVYVPNHMRYVDNQEHFSEILRVLLVEKYGGFWINYDIPYHICLDNTFHTNADMDFYGYFTEDSGKFPVIENSIFGAPEQSSFITKWKNKLYKISTFDCNEDYVNYVQAIGIDLHNIQYPKRYPANIAIQVVLQSSKMMYKHKLMTLDLLPLNSLVQ